MNATRTKFLKSIAAAKVLTPEGEKLLSDIKVGDIVIGADESGRMEQRVAQIKQFVGVHNTIYINDIHAFAPHQSLFVYREGKKIVLHAQLIREGDCIYTDTDHLEIVEKVENIKHPLKIKRISLELEEVGLLNRYAQKIYCWFTGKPRFNRSYFLDRVLVHNATRFWVGGSGNWDGSDTTHWAATSGGSSGASVPTSSDTVTADSNSGASATATITGTTALASSITINKSDFILLHNAGSTVSGTVTLTTGQINTNGQTCSWGIFRSNNANTRTITMGATTLTLTTASQTVWATNNSTGFTFSCASATVICNATTQSVAMVSTQTIGTLTMSGAAATFTTGGTVTNMNFTGSGTATISSALVTTNFNRTGTASTGDTLTIAGSLTTSGNFTLAGQSTTNRLLVQSSVLGTRRTITNTSSTPAWSYVDIQDTGLSSAYNASAITGNSGDCGNNLNITFTTGATQNLTMSTNKNWNDVTIWTSRIPLPQDDITATAWTGGTLTVNMPRMGRNMDFSAATGSCTLSTGAAFTGFGSYILGSAVTISGGGNGFLRGSGTHTITMAGKSFGSQITVSARTGGSYALNDAFSTSSTGTFEGVLVTNNYNITGTILSFSGLTAGSTIGTSVISCTATTNSTVFTGSATISFSTATVAVTTTATVTRSVQLNGGSYGTVDISIAGSTGIIVINSSNTIDRLLFADASNARTLQFNNGTTNTINTWDVDGTSGKKMSIRSSTPGSTYTIVLGTVQSGEYLDIQDMNVTGGPLYAGVNSTDSGNNNANVIFANAFIQRILMF